MHRLHVPDLPLPLELRAEFIHGEAAASFSIVDAAGLHVYELPDNHWWSRDGKWELIGDFWAQIDRVRAKGSPPRHHRDAHRVIVRSRLPLDPALTAKQRAIEKLEVGHVAKIAFQFRERF